MREKITLVSHWNKVVSLPAEHISILTEDSHWTFPSGLYRKHTTDSQKVFKVKITLALSLYCWN